jgi:hypothetical protein
MSATLIFPCCVPAGVLYAEEAERRGEQVVAASSLRYDETATKFETWFYLPSVHEDDFAQRLDEAIARYHIARVYCPVLTAYDLLLRWTAEGRFSLPIINGVAFGRHLSEHRNLMEAAAARLAFIQDLTAGRSPLSLMDVAATLRQSLGVFGESDETKIAAMMAIFADAPKGDVVEIGVLAGRSACVLALMARRHDSGAVLVVDPWSTSQAVQRDSAQGFQRMHATWSPSMPIEPLFESFIVSLLPIVRSGEFNYLAMPSRQAHAEWSRQNKVETPHFGAVSYSGSISVLHIDGNHDYTAVSEDCALWLPHVMPGGWLILDDYVWFHGDGPRRVGDALLAELADDVQRAFVCGKALFVKLGG